MDRERKGEREGGMKGGEEERKGFPLTCSTEINFLEKKKQPEFCLSLKITYTNTK